MAKRKRKSPRFLYRSHICTGLGRLDPNELRDEDPTSFEALDRAMTALEAKKRKKEKRRKALE